MNPKKNISLIVGLSIPVLMILLVTASIYLPSLFIPAPQSDFLYVVEDGHGSVRQYAVENNTLVRREVKYSQNYGPIGGTLFVYDVSANADREISFEEAQKLKLDTNIKSPDGYEVVYGSTDYGLFPLFFSSGRDYDAMYLKRNNVSKKLNLQSSANGRYYYRAWRFLAWIH